MGTDPGEYIAGCYLKKVLGCDFVDYNVRPPGGGMRGLSELDVVGLRLKDKTAFLCEVATHINGFNYGDSKKTVARVVSKHERQQEYAREYLKDFQNVRYMFWSPVVAVGQMTAELAKISTLELIINGRFRQCVEELRVLARAEAHESGNIFFRYLQIMERLRENV